MSNTTRHGDRVQDNPTPRAMVHKKILDAAERDPDTSIEGLADQIGGATVQLVERVLDEYGDPAIREDQGNAGTTDHTGTGSQNDDNSSGAQPNEKTREQTNGTVPSMKERNVNGNEHSMDAKQANGTEQSIDDTQTNGTEPGEATAPDHAEKEPGTTKQNVPEAGDPPNGSADAGVSASTSEDSPDGVETDRTEQQGSTDPTDRSGQIEHQRIPDPESLTEKRLEVVRAIHDQPHATQAELADQLGVSRATISQRVNAIDGFEWSDRQEYVKAVFEGQKPMSDGNGPSVEQLATQIDSLTDRIGHLEQTIRELSDAQSVAFDDPELAATVVRACLDSDTVTEQEEQQIIVEVIESGRYSNSYTGG